jgi:hypothetical protein
MPLSLLGAAKRALGLHSPGRNLDVFADDTFLASYPKSGNTWTRFLIANLVYPERRPDFTNINELIPDPEALSKRRLAALPRPRIIKTHQYYHPGYKNVICIVRDPRDVAISEFHFHRKRRVYSDATSLESHVDKFIAGETTVYGSWGENIASWLATRTETQRFLLVRYEDMLEHTERELTRIAEFLNVALTKDRLEQAITRSSAANMRKLEKVQSLTWSTTKQTRQDIPFVRSATSGNWKEELPSSCAARIETAWSPVMKYLGYHDSSIAAACG